MKYKDSNIIDELIARQSARKPVRVLHQSTINTARCPRKNSWMYLLRNFLKLEVFVVFFTLLFTLPYTYAQTVILLCIFSLGALFISIVIFLDARDTEFTLNETTTGSSRQWLYNVSEDEDAIDYIGNPVMVAGSAMWEEYISDDTNDSDPADYHDL